MLSLMVVFGLLRSRTKPLIVRFNILQLKISPHCSEERMEPSLMCFNQPRCIVV